MHDEIIERMNNKVQKNDELYMLGDISFYSGKKVTDILHKINGRKHLIIGNHDPKSLKNTYPWESVSDIKEIKDGGQRIILCHYPIHSWKGRSHGAIHLHGHTHGTLDNFNPWVGFRCDVGVDVWDFEPVSLDEIGKLWLKMGKLV